MEELNSRFEHISKQIFDKLDNKSLADCMEVSPNWYHFLQDQKFLNIIIILETVMNTKGRDTNNIG